MPEQTSPAADQAPVPAAFTALGDAWEALFRANEAFIAVDATASKAYAIIGMSVLRRRAHEFLTALDDLMEETSR